jgi:DNA-binding CsgD family transcriptional regulator
MSRPSDEHLAKMSRAGWLSQQAAMAKRDAVIARLTLAGRTAAEISAELGISERTVQRARGRAGVAQPFNGIPMSDSEVQQAAALLDDGASYAEVGRTLGRSHGTIRRQLPARSVWKPGSGIEYRRLIAGLEAIDTTPREGVAS